LQSTAESSAEVKGIVAGMTYGKGSLNEMVVGNEKKGLRRDVQSCFINIDILIITLTIKSRRHAGFFVAPKRKYVRMYYLRI